MKIHLQDFPIEQLNFIEDFFKSYSGELHKTEDSFTVFSTKMSAIDYLTTCRNFDKKCGFEPTDRIWRVYKKEDKVVLEVGYAKKRGCALLASKNPSIIKKWLSCAPELTILDSAFEDFLYEKSPVYLNRLEEMFPKDFLAKTLARLANKNRVYAVDEIVVHGALIPKNLIEKNSEVLGDLAFLSSKELDAIGDVNFSSEMIQKIKFLEGKL